MPHLIIGISGKKKAGKDTCMGCLQHLLPRYSIARVAFADKVKQEVSKATGIPVNIMEANKDVFRSLYQWWGTDFRRKFILHEFGALKNGENYWVDRWLDVVKYLIQNESQANLLIVAPDVRFPNEVEAIESLGGFVFRVARQTVDVTDTHDSECMLDTYDFKGDIVLNTGTIQQCCDQVSDVLKKKGIL